MSVTNDNLSDEIDRTLRSLIHVPRLNRGGFISRPGFWDRCCLVTPNWRDQFNHWIFVDGFENASKWNAWKVFTDSLEDGLSLWLGYALFRGSWKEHAWCMLGDRIVESTLPFRIYYGAELTGNERELFGKEYGGFDLVSRTNTKVFTIADCFRELVPFDPKLHGASIGRERDFKTGMIKDGLGR